MVFDLARLGRQRAAFAYRVLYGAALLALAGSAHQAGDPTDATSTFLGVQVLLVLVITPLLVFASISSERRQRTLELLLTTDLNDRELVFRFFFLGLARIWPLVLVGIPGLVVLEILGGVDPLLALLGYGLLAVLAATMTALAVASWMPDETRQGNTFYRHFTGTLILTVISLAYLLAIAVPRQTFPVWRELLLINCLAAALAVPALLIFATRQIRINLLEAGPPPEEASKLLFGLFRFHLPASPPDSKRVHDRPPIGDRPLLWKELSASRSKPAVRDCFAVLIIYLAFVGLGLSQAYADKTPLLDQVGHVVPLMANIFLARLCGTCIACGLLILISLVAAGRITQERERRTLETLLTIPRSSHAICMAMLTGAIGWPRQYWPVLATCWGAATLLAGIHAAYLPLLVLAWCVLAFLFAALGLCVSALCSSTRQATFWTVLLLALIFLGWSILDFWLTPPGMFVALARPYGEDFASAPPLGPLLACLLVSAVAGLTLYGLTWLRFKNRHMVE